MASLTDVPRVLRTLGPLTFLKRLWKEMGEDNLFMWASSMAFSWLFAIFPFMLFLLTLIPYLKAEWKQEAKHQLAVNIYRLPKEAADTIWVNVEARLDEVLHRPRRQLLGIGLLITLWAASAGMSMTMSALDRCYDVTSHRPFYKQRPLAILLTIITATLVLAVIILLPVGTVVTHWVVDRSGAFISKPLLFAWQAARYALAFMLMFAILAVVYYFGPNIRHRFRIFSPGAIFSVAVWLLLGLAFRFYVDRFGRYNEMYGTVGGVAVLLLFFYIDALVMLVGAEINSEIDKTVEQQGIASRGDTAT